jgi:mannose-6-phosphate isomerase-like protein (cupin superfamily)
MKLIRLIAILFVTLNACAPNAGEIPSSAILVLTEESVQLTIHPEAIDPLVGKENGWQIWRWQELLADTKSSGYFSFLEEESLSAGIYRLPAESLDGQNPHARDEVYIVMEGRANFVAEDEILAVEAGSIIYVRAKVEHKFEVIEEPLNILVLFSKNSSSEANPSHQHNLFNDLIQNEELNRNIWNEFLSVSSLRLGLYSLPSTVGGDSPLVHSFDELNLVINGSGSFTVNDEEIQIEEGDLIFVRAGNSHSFDTQGQDLEVLILFLSGE